MNPIYLNEDSFGDQASKEDAVKIIAKLVEMGWAVEYGQAGALDYMPDEDEALRLQDDITKAIDALFAE